MIEFHDYDPAHPFAVNAETHIIRDNKVTLNYAPLKGSVNIDGWTEDETGELPQGTFFINYGEKENYRTADQIVHFPSGYDGIAVTVDYQGVSTLLRAEHMNEIKLAARIIAEHEQLIIDALIQALDEHCGHITHALDNIAEAIEQSGGGVDPSKIATDEEADEVLDEYIPGDVEPTPTSTRIASDKEAEAVIDQYLPLPTTGAGSETYADAADEDDI